MHIRINNLTHIKNLIINSFLFGDSSKLSFDTNLFEFGIIDSTGIIELISFIEGEFNITVNQADLIPDNFSSLEKVNNFLRKKTEGI